MIFHPAAVAGVQRIELEPVRDERGFFSRTFCTREFAEHGLADAFVQSGTSFSASSGTLRGLHYQAPPAAESKLVRCIAGAIFDVVVDLRPDSPSFERFCTHVLRAADREQLYVPTGCAHGFLTLEDDTEVTYLLSNFHSVEHARRVRWNDPRFGIPWPTEPSVISAADAECPDFSD
ncbi:MAG: dTDP-4-dehydrorhamnose 3,5-epimerase [Deltaproteobacteria bacterium]|nr:dTDP-4-dehydrorhamnose 3,5-epimerase [Deltaproteobacteria bacterium]MBW2363078.1 dTDP-4-dehydrorhamnose 3,5-epimerase [Deltaproteobacteria bacterium]